MPTFSIQGTERTPSLWTGASLRPFGVNPYGQPVYRVIWGPSRYYLVGGAWEDRDSRPATNAEMALEGKDTSLKRKVVEYRWIPKYPKQAWILEKWLTPFQYGGTPQQWALSTIDPETGLLTLGPYPEKGEYEECYIFPEGYPPYSAVASMIQMLEYGKNFSFQQRKDAHYKALAQQKRDQQNRIEAQIRDLAPKCVPISGYGNKGKDSSDHAAEIKFRLTAEEAGLPTENNKFLVKGK